MAPPPVREVVVSLAMIRNLVFSYANGAVLPSDIFAIEEALCYILVHTHNWIKNQEEDEEEEEVPVDEALSPEEEERRLEIVAAAREEDVNDKIAIFYHNPVPPSPPSRSASPGKPTSNVGPRPVELIDPSFSLRHNHIDLTESLAEPTGVASEDGDESKPSTGVAARATDSSGTPRLIRCRCRR